jgi:hypothetical protein
LKGPLDAARRGNSICIVTVMANCVSALFHRFSRCHLCHCFCAIFLCFIEEPMNCGILFICVVQMSNDNSYNWSVRDLRSATCLVNSEQLSAHCICIVRYTWKYELQLLCHSASTAYLSLKWLPRSNNVAI